MTVPLASFFGKDLPKSIWKSDVLHLPNPLIDAHADFLIEKGWIGSYQPGPGAGVGGKLPKEAQDHVTNRFLNSAARMQFVCSDPNDNQPDVRDMVLEQLGDGNVFLLDLAAGNGAGTLAMLALLCELRAHKTIPTLPLNLSIVGVDFSAEALEFYGDLLRRISPWFKTQGINISLNCELCDLMVSGEFSEVFENFIDDANQKNVKRFLCVISALSGVGKEGLEKVHDSLKLAAAGLGSRGRNSSFLWVEPFVDKAWPVSFGDSVRLVLKRVAHKFSRKGDTFAIETDAPLMEKFATRTFDWHDPHKAKNASSRVYVMSFKSE